MSLPTGRGAERVRSCGLLRKWGDAGKQIRLERSEVLGACIIRGTPRVNREGQHDQRVPPYRGCNILQPWSAVCPGNYEKCRRDVVETRSCTLNSRPKIDVFKVEPCHPSP
jgi:hypothetical protein